MHPMHRGPVLARAVHRSSASSYTCTNCTRRTFHQQPALREGEDGTPQPAARPANRREGAQMASRMIQGLRGMAPGGFGGKVAQNAPRRTENIAQDMARRNERKGSVSTTTRSIDLRGNTSPTSTETRNSGPTITRVSGPPVRRANITHVNTGSHIDPRERGTGAIQDRRRDGPKRDRRKDMDVSQKKRDEERRISTAEIVAKLLKTTNAPADRKNAEHHSDQSLRERYQQGKVIRFVDEEQSQRMKPSFQKGPYKVLRLQKEHIDLIVEKAVAGKYQAVKAKEPKQNPTLAHMVTSLSRNGSYDQKAREALVDFMGSRLPGQRQAQPAAS